MIFSTRPEKAPKKQFETLKLMKRLILIIHSAITRVTCKNDFDEWRRYTQMFINKSRFLVYEPTVEDHVALNFYSKWNPKVPGNWLNCLVLVLRSLLPIATRMRESFAKAMERNCDQRHYASVMIVNESKKILKKNLQFSIIH